MNKLLSNKNFLFIIFLYFLIFNSNNKQNTKKNEFELNIKEILPNISIKENKSLSLIDIFNSRQLFINDLNLTNEYIRYIRPISQKDQKIKKRKIYNKALIKNFREREKKTKYFAKLSVREKLIQTTYKSEINSNNNPLISVILPSYNKEKVVMKSIRSIQNQSLKNIEIIIVDDCSTDNTKKYYNYLLKTDQRSRIFYHEKNMGVWRSRIDGLLYSRGKYVIHFDTGDLYADQFVLEDAFNLAEKYNLDSVRMLFKEINNYNNIEKQKIPNFPINEEYNKIVYNKQNIINYNKKIFMDWGTLWTRLTKANIFIKGLYLLNSYLLNIYKNFWEDIWWNRIVDEVSDNLLIYHRYAYLYYFDGKGEGTIKEKTILGKDKMIQEYIYFLYFDLEFLPEKDNKKSIINKLKQYNDKNQKINIKCLISKFYILNNLIFLLLKDKYIRNRDKIFLKKLLLKK